MLQQETGVKVYGANWCGHTTMARRHLDELGVPYQYIDVDDNPEASQWVKDHNHGMEVKPTIDVDGTVMTNPSNSELDSALMQAGLLNQGSGDQQQGYAAS